MNIQNGSDSKVNTLQKHRDKKDKDKAILRSLMNSVWREIKYKLNFWTLGITALLVVFSILIVLWKPFPGLEEWTQDYRQRSRLAGMNNLIYPNSALSKFKNNLPLPGSEEYSQCFDVCIITEDEKSIHDLDGTPFSPEEYSQVVYMLQEFGVDVIVFDKLFFEERKKHFSRGYENMLKAIERSKNNGINTVVGWKYDVDPDSGNIDLKAYGPTDDVRELTKKGFINVILSQTDKGVREYSFLYPEGASLAMSAYLSAINPEYSEDVSKIVDFFSKNKNVNASEIAKSQLKVDENDKISKPRTIEFYGKPGTIPVHPFHELIRAFHILYPDYAECKTYEEKYNKLKEILESGANEELQELLVERADNVEDIKKLEASKQGKSDEEIEIIDANIETIKTDFLDEIDLEIAEIKESLKSANTNVLEKLDKTSWSTKDRAFFDRLQKSLSRKVAVIGPWTLDSQDLYNVPITTPTDAEARMYGVEIHATMIQNLFDIMNSSDPKVLDGFTYPDVSENIQFVIGVVIFTALITIFITPLWSAALMILAAILYWMGASYSFVYNTHFYPIVYPVFAMLSTFVIMTVTKFFATDKQRRQIDGMFKSYVDRKFVDLLKRDPSKIKLGGERKEISVFFSDIAGFSTFSESMEPEEIVEVLNKYLGAMTETILEYDGTLDKYIGDAVMAFWNAPMNLEDHATLACVSALMQRKRLYELREDWVKQGYPEIDCRMGINTGQIVHANMGSTLRKNYTLMGDPVNLAARFEPLNKDFDTNIIIGERTYELAKNDIVVRPLGKVQVKGRSEPVKFFELVGLLGDVETSVLEKIDTFTSGLQNFYDGDFKAAKEFFEVILTAFPEDGPALKYIKLCNHYIEEMPDLKTWTGTYVQTSK